MFSAPVLFDGTSETVRIKILYCIYSNNLRIFKTKNAKIPSNGQYKKYYIHVPVKEVKVPASVVVMTSPLPSVCVRSGSADVTLPSVCCFIVTVDDCCEAGNVASDVADIVYVRAGCVTPSLLFPDGSPGDIALVGSTTLVSTLSCKLLVVPMLLV